MFRHAELKRFASTPFACADASRSGTRSPPFEIPAERNCGTPRIRVKDN
jgi:hypothetical protein